MMEHRGDDIIAGVVEVCSNSTEFLPINGQLLLTQHTLNRWESAGRLIKC